MKNTRTKRARAFTLVELLTALAIAVILVTIAIIAYGRIEEKARAVQARGELTQLAMTIQLDTTDTNRLTLDLQWLADRHLAGALPRDPWDRPYLAGLLCPAPACAHDIAAWTDTPAGLRLLALGEGPFTVELTIVFTDGTSAQSNFSRANLPADIPLTAAGPRPRRIMADVAAPPGAIGAALAIFAFRQVGSATVSDSLPARVDPRGTFVLLSTGADREFGGAGVNADIAWRSDYGEFAD